MIAVMVKTPYDNVFRTLLNKSSIPVANKTFRGPCTGGETRSRRASVPHLARSVAGLKAPISPLLTWSEMGRIPDSFSELTTTPVVEFAVRKKQYKQPCDLPLTFNDIRKILEQNRTEQNRRSLLAGFLVFKVFFVARHRRNNPLYPILYPISFFPKNLSGLRGIQDTLWVTHFIDVLFLFFRETLTYSSGMDCSVMRSSGLLLSAG